MTIPKGAIRDCTCGDLLWRLGQWKASCPAVSEHERFRDALLQPMDRQPDLVCERCGKRHLSEAVWLELDSVTGIYHQPGQVAPERSQGGFPFGAKCAKRQLAHQKRTAS